MDRNKSRLMAQELDGFQIRTMLNNAKERITNWEEASKVNKSMTKGVSWNILTHDFNPEYYDNNNNVLMKVNLIREFGEYLPQDILDKYNKKKPKARITITHQEPDLDREFLTREERDQQIQDAMNNITEEDLDKYFGEIEKQSRGWEHIADKVGRYIESVGVDNLEPLEDKFISYFKRYNDYRFDKHSEMSGVPNIFMGLFEYAQKSGEDVFEQMEDQDFLQSANKLGPYVFTCYSGQGVVFHIEKDGQNIFTS